LEYFCIIFWCAEVPVIEDINDQLDKVQNIFVEYHSPLYERQGLDRILKILTKNDFRYFIETITPREKPFIQKNIGNDRFDMQVNISAYQN